MENQGLSGVLLEILIKLQAFMVRPNVQIQLIAILAILLGIGFVSGMVVVAINRRQAAFPLPSKEDDETAEDTQTSTSRNQLLQRVLYMGTNLLVFPLLALITTNIVIFILQSQNRATGLLALLGFILSFLLLYHVFLLILYLAFPEKKVRRFQTRLFGPLFALFVLYEIIQLFANVSVLGTVALFADLLESPITLGALFLATVGLYFWIDSVLGLKEIIFELLTRFTPFNKGRLDASLTLGSYILIATGLVLALSLLGVGSTTFAAVVGGLSVGIGFGMGEIWNNLASGILLLFEGTIKPGDQVEIGGGLVTIKKLGIRATLVESPDHIETIVPNKDLFTKSVTSYTSTHPIIRIKIPIISDHGNDPEDITRILEEAARQCSRVSSEHSVQAIIKGLGADGINYELRVWSDISKNSPAAVRNQVYRAIAKAFVEHDIEINPDPDMDNFLEVASTFLQARKQTALPSLPS